LAEFIATCVMIVLGDGVVAQVVLSDNAKGQYLSISFGWCFGVMCAIYIAGGISVGYTLQKFGLSTLT
jgi:aquaglyceroporin related protein